MANFHRTGEHQSGTHGPPEEEDEDDDEARAVTYKFHRAASGDVQQELLIDFEFA